MTCGNQRLPAQLQEQLRIVKRTRRGIDHVAMDAAVLAGGEGLLAESRKLFCPEKPCQPYEPNQSGGSMRPVEWLRELWSSTGRD